MSARKLGRLAGLVFVLAVVLGGVGAAGVPSEGNTVVVEVSSVSLEAVEVSSLSLEWD